MTIDEAIAHAREVAERNMKDANDAIEDNKKYDRNTDSILVFENIKANDDIIESCNKCAEQNKQIAEWLEELKMYRECVVFKNMNCRDNIIAYETINRFVVLLKSRLTDAIHQKDVSSMLNLIYEIADQLKDGIKDAESN